MPVFLGLIGGGLAAGVGGGLMSFFGAKSQAKKAAEAKAAAASQVKLDYPSEISSALGDINQFLPQAGQTAGKVASADQLILDSLREQTMPGSAKRRDKLLEIIDSYLKGELSPAMTSAISRSAAAQGAAKFGNVGGAIPLRAEAGMLGRTAEEQVGRGVSLLGQFQQLFPAVQAPSVASFLGGTPQQRLAMRGQEQSQIGSILSGVQAPPGLGSFFGPMFQGLGGIATGAGATGLVSGGFGGGTTGGAAPYGNPTPGYMGSSGGAAYFYPPTTRTGY